MKRVHIVGRKGGIAYALGLENGQGLEAGVRVIERELKRARERRDREETAYLGEQLHAIHFNQKVADWESELLRGATTSPRTGKEFVDGILGFKVN